MTFGYFVFLGAWARSIDRQHASSAWDRAATGTNRNRRRWPSYRSVKPLRLLPFGIIAILAAAILLTIRNSPELRERMSILRDAAAGSSLSAARARLLSRGYACGELFPPAPASIRADSRNPVTSLCGRYDKPAYPFARRGIELDMYGARNIIEHSQTRSCYGLQPEHACRDVIPRGSSTTAEWPARPSLK